MSGVNRVPSASTDSFKSKSQVLQHAGRFDDAAELELTPLAADVRRAQRLHEPAGFHLKGMLRLMERSKLLGQRGRGPDAVLFDFLKLAVDFRERLLERLHEIFDGLLTAVEIHPSRFLEFRQRGLCEIEKGLIVLAERVGGQRRERFAELFLCIFQKGQLV